MPQTDGYTNIWPTLATIFAFNINVWMMAKIIHSGVQLGILVPLLTAVIPLGTITIGIIYYGESADPLKIGLLFIACGLVVGASRIT